MSDMLVKLYELPEFAPLATELRRAGVDIRRADPSEKPAIVQWVGRQFRESWAVECDVAFQRRPVACFIAVIPGQEDAAEADPYQLPPDALVGFACYDATRKGMFGPEGVHPRHRGRGIGKALLLACLHAMKDERYAYAVIGWAGPVEFYSRTVGATVIEGSEPGIYRGPLSGFTDKDGGTRR